MMMASWVTALKNQASPPEKVVATNVTAIAAGEFHSLFLKSDSSLWAMGNNDDGELGDGTYSEADSPEKIVATNVTAIAAGQWHSLFLKNDGSLWAMGWGEFGQLGDGSYNNNGVNTPEKIVTTNVTAIAAGWNHSLFIMNDGSLWAMGNNAYGQLGDGHYNSTGINKPEKVVASGVTAIAAGEYHSLFLKSDGSLWAMGNNADGQLGDGTWNDQVSPEKIVATNVTAIAAGRWHSLFLKSDGSLWGMGYNEDGELGDATLNDTNRTEQILGAFNRVAGQLLSGPKMRLSFMGLDRNELRAGPHVQPGLGQLGAADHQSSRLGRGAGAHQHAERRPRTISGASAPFLELEVAADVSPLILLRREN